MTVAAAPIGFGLTSLAKLMLAPYSYAIVKKRDMKVKENELWQKYGFIVRIIYFPIGVILALLVAIQTIFTAITIIGIPVAGVMAEWISVYFNPVGKKCVPRAVAEEIERRKAQEYLDKNNKDLELESEIIKAE